MQKYSAKAIIRLRFLLQIIRIYIEESAFEEI